VAGARHLGKSDGTPGIGRQPFNTLDDRGPVLLAMLIDFARPNSAPKRCSHRSKIETHHCFRHERPRVKSRSSDS